jgi:hypothetical protein
VEEGRVMLSPGAAGYGWSVDAAAPSSSAFSSRVVGGPLAAPAWPSSGRMDLLTTVLHEMGHLAGLPDVGGSGGRGT